MRKGQRAVFVSHSSANHRIVKKVCAALEEGGIPYWVSTRDIDGGTNWAAEIMDGIRESRVVVMIFSKESNSSEHVKREIKLATDQKIPLVLFRTDEEALSPELEYFLSTPQVVSIASSRRPRSEHLYHLVEETRILLDKQGIKTKRPRSTRHRLLRLTRLAAMFLLAIWASLVVADVVDHGKAPRTAMVDSAQFLATTPRAVLFVAKDLSWDVIEAVSGGHVERKESEELDRQRKMELAFADRAVFKDVDPEGDGSEGTTDVEPDGERERKAELVLQLMDDFHALGEFMARSRLDDWDSEFESYHLHERHRTRFSHLMTSETRAHLLELARHLAPDERRSIDQWGLEGESERAAELLEDIADYDAQPEVRRKSVLELASIVHGDVAEDTVASWELAGSGTEAVELLRGVGRAEATPAERRQRIIELARLLSPTDRALARPASAGSPGAAIEAANPAAVLQKPGG